jgi:hypothetical protein
MINCANSVKWQQTSSQEHKIAARREQLQLKLLNYNYMTVISLLLESFLFLEEAFKEPKVNNNRRRE